MPAGAIYARISKKLSDETTSLRTQEESCRQLATLKGYTIDPAFVHSEDFPGDTLDRPKLSLLITQIRNHAFDALFCHATDRLARSPIHLAIIAEYCEKAKVELHFVTEPLDTSPEGQLILYVKGYAAQIEREKIKERTTRGRKERMRGGKLPTGGGPGLYGYFYDKPSGRRTINEEEATIVRMIFRWVIDEDCTVHTICLRLTEKGIPAPRGGVLWNPSTISRMLRNPMYAGITMANKVYYIEPKHYLSENPRRRKTTARTRPEDEWIPMPDDLTPAIITQKEQAQAAESIHQHMEQSTRNGHYEYLLRGHLFCGLCGGRMYGEPGRKQYRYYGCRFRRRLQTLTPCRNRLVHADEIEQEVWEAVKNALLDPEVLFAEIERQIQAEPNNAEALLDALDSRLKKNKKQQERLVKLFALGEIDEAMIETQVKILKREAAGLEAEKQVASQTRSKRQSLVDAREQLGRFCEQAAENIEHFGFAEKRDALAALQIRVEVAGEKASLTGIVPITFPSSSRGESYPYIPFSLMLANRS